MRSGARRRRAAARRRGARRARAAAPRARPSTGINPKYTFEQFVIGDANRFAHAAALAVAELPGQAYNPLFIYGPPGVGKTHLLHSIGNYVLAYGAGLDASATRRSRPSPTSSSPRCSGGDMDRFKGRYRHADVLLIDDVQFLASKAKTEEEFFHTFNALHDIGSQLVLTSDRLPRDLSALEDRLRERFEAGLVTDIEPPDLATRVAVLRKRVQHDGVALADDGVLALLADRAPDNVRALEGALIRVVAYASLTGRPLDHRARRGGPRRPLPRRAGEPARPRAPLTVEAIQDVTADAFGLTPRGAPLRPAAPPASPGRARSRCTSRASTRARPCPPSARASAGATTPPSCTPAGARPQRIAADPEAFDSFGASPSSCIRGSGTHGRRQFSPT